MGARVYRQQHSSAISTFISKIGCSTSPHAFARRNTTQPNPTKPNPTQRWRTLPGAAEGYDYSDVKFVELDLGDASSLSKALDGCDLVVHTAGPFQRKTSAEVLEAAIKAKARMENVLPKTDQRGDGDFST